jgi:hypothetical protein
MKVIVENVLSSLTLPKTIIIASSITLKNANILIFKIRLLAIYLHMQVVGLQSCWDNMAELQLDYIMVTKIDDYCSNKITFSKGGWQTPFGCMILAW